MAKQKVEVNKRVTEWNKHVYLNEKPPLTVSRITNNNLMAMHTVDCDILLLNVYILLKCMWYVACIHHANVTKGFYCYTHVIISRLVWLKLHLFTFGQSQLLLCFTSRKVIKLNKRKLNVRKAHKSNWPNCNFYQVTYYCLLSNIICFATWTHSEFECVLWCNAESFTLH